MEAVDSFDLTIFVPTRGRAKVLAPFMENWRAVTSSRSRVVFVIDTDDPQFRLYEENFKSVAGTDVAIIAVLPTARGMVGALNEAFRHEDERSNRLGYAVGFMGDDHRPRTYHWDEAYLQTLRGLGTGFVYGNDLFQGETIPTQVAMTTDIPRALGWMAPPVLHHLFVDNAWKTLGQRLDKIRYLDGVIVEHMHPLAGKGDKRDKNYAVVNNSVIVNHDKAAYDLWVLEELEADVQRIQTRLLSGE